MSEPADFEWSSEKAVANAAKHRVTFDLAVLVFKDDRRLILDTTREVDGEIRYKCIGRVAGRLLTVVYTKRQGCIRVISARRANGKEERSYGDRSL